MNPVILIDKKRRGESLTDDEIQFLVEGFTNGGVRDYQMSAWAMAVVWHGMDDRETLSLTTAMLRSGCELQWEPGPPVVDKHSTGGIGDKSSLILAPLLACVGARVPMISGRGLGATGGTLDKLDSIPGFRSKLSLDELRRQVSEIGCAMIGQTAEICPADRKLYALRDATATVASIPLITASILCKKLAEGLDGLVLDVKFGSGAFMTTKKDAERLAHSMERVLTAFGKTGRAHLNSMEEPTGRMVGNALEVLESIDVLQGTGPRDLKQLVYRLATSLVVDAGLAADEPSAERMFDQAIGSGAAFEKFEAMVKHQGGRINDLKIDALSADFVADRSGVFHIRDASKIGYALVALGGGRKSMEDRIDPAVGFEFLIRNGERVQAGQPLLRLFYRTDGEAEARSLLRSAIEIA